MEHLAQLVWSHIVEIAGHTPISAEFLAALTANESGGNTHAKRFEPAVYRHLTEVAAGRALAWGSIGKHLLDKEIAEVEAQIKATTAAPQASAAATPSSQSTGAKAPAAAQPTSSAATTGGTKAPETSPPSDASAGTSGSAGPSVAGEAAQPSSASPLAAKADSYHEAHLSDSFTASYSQALSIFRDEAIRHLATSWGLTQIMGYHMLGRPEPVERLCDPAFHYRVATDLLQDFAKCFHLDPQRDFEALFRCWNTGRPDGKTYDPDYVQNGLRRIEVCRQLGLKAGQPAKG